MNRGYVHRVRLLDPVSTLPHIYCTVELTQGSTMCTIRHGRVYQQNRGHLFALYTVWVKKKPYNASVTVTH